MGKLDETIAAYAATTEEWGGWDHENSILEVVSPALELRVAHHVPNREDTDGVNAYFTLKTLFLKQLAATEIKTGVFRRSPHDVKQNSHDNIVAALMGSYLYWHHWIAEDIQNALVCGLYITGPKVKDGKVTRGLDGEYFMFWRPEYRAYLQIATTGKCSLWCYMGLLANLWFSRAFNMQRVKLLFLNLVIERQGGFYLLRLLMPKLIKRLGTHYKGRYGDNPYYKALWEANGGRYARF